MKVAFCKVAGTWSEQEAKFVSTQRTCWEPVAFGSSVSAELQRCAMFGIV